ELHRALVVRDGGVDEAAAIFSHGERGECERALRLGAQRIARKGFCSLGPLRLEAVVTYASAVREAEAECCAREIWSLMERLGVESNGALVVIALPDRSVVARTREKLGAGVG